MKSSIMDWTRSGKHLRKNDEEFKFPDRQSPCAPAGVGGIASVVFAAKVRSCGSATKQIRPANARSRCPKRREKDSTRRLVRYTARDSRRDSNWSPGKSRRSSRCAGSGGPAVE